MLDYIVAALGALASIDVLLICMTAAIAGIILGAIPGLSGGMGIALLLPITYAMDTTTAVAMMMSLYVGGVSGGYIGSILLGIPGTTGSISTVYDGYEFTKKGDPVPAISAATVANFIGTLPSLIIAMFLCKWIASFAIKMGPWEYFALMSCAIVMIVSLSKGNLVKGLLGAALGLFVTTIGNSPVSATVRFTFGNYFLAGGLPFISVMIGVFAGRIILVEYGSGKRLHGEMPKIKIRGFSLKGTHFFRNIWNIIRSFFIGLWIGFLPGLGATLANVTAYTTAKNSSKHANEFGKGCIDGVWAPETANNASVGGAIIPLIALGIPGDGITAIIMSGLLLQGLELGPLLTIVRPDVVYMIFVSAMIFAIFVLLVQVFGMKLFPSLLRVPYHYLYPAILVLCFVGTFVSAGNISGIYTTILFSAIGVWLEYANIPITPFILAFVLGGSIEKHFRNGISMSPEYGILSFFMRPVSAVFLALALFLLIWPFIRDHRKAKKVS